jgi:pyridoxine 5-phosphate synthase
MIELGVNIDHVATVRQARRTHEPDPVWASVEAHLGGADGITVHLREDRRHIQDEDVRRLRELTHIKLNLEMAATDEMLAIAARIRPEMAMLVPEGRHEVTTEGGLDIVSQEARIREIVASLAGAGITTSVFIDAELAQVEAAFVARQPMGRVGRVDEIAALAVYLASDESSFTTGTAQVIDGGWSN